MTARLFVAAALLFVTVQSYAASWFSFEHGGTPRVLYFFDADTVVKNPGTVMLWTKSVRESHAPNADGSYFVASKVMFTCAAHTIRAISLSSYDANEGYMGTTAGNNHDDEVVPGSLGEAMLEVVCAPDFPTNRSNRDYSAVPSNDIKAEATRYFDMLKTMSSK